FGYTQDDLARTVGKSRSHITNLLRLLSLPEEVKNLLNNGLLTMGHARALLGCPDPVVVADRIIAEDLSVRQTEQLSQGLIQESTRKLDLTPERNQKESGAKKGNNDRPQLQHEELRSLEESLSESLNAKVSIHAKGRAGEIKIS